MTNYIDIYLKIIIFLFSWIQNINAYTIKGLVFRKMVFAFIFFSNSYYF